MYTYFYRETEREIEEEIMRKTKNRSSHQTETETRAREMKNKKEDKQRRRVTQFGVRGDNGIITLNYNNILPHDPRPIQSGLRSFRESSYKMSSRG